MMNLTALPPLLLGIVSFFSTSVFADVDPRFSEFGVDASTGEVHGQVRLNPPKQIVRVEAWSDQTKLADGSFIAYDDQPDSATAYAFVIDVSNPARRATIARCVEAAVALAGKLNDRADIAVFSLGSSVKVEAPFGSTREKALEAIKLLKPEGDQAYATLIYTGCKEIVENHLKGRPAGRKALVVFTDGKDETGKGKPDEAQIQRIKAQDLIASALAAKVVIHALGYVEQPSELTELDNINDASQKTYGAAEAAETGSGKLPDAFVASFPAYLSSGGRATFAATPLAGKSAVFVKFIADDGAEFRVPERPEGVLDPAPPAPTAPAVVPSVSPDGAPGASTPSAGEVSPPLPSAVKPGKPWLLPVLIGGIVLFLGMIALILRRAKIAAEAEAAARRAEIANENDEEPDALFENTSGPVAPAPSRTPLAWLVMLDAEQTKIPVTQTSARIGRGQEDEIRIRNDSVSRSHCNLKRSGDGQWVVVDLESGNGVLLNGRRVESSVVKEGDVIELGEVKMRFVIAD